MASDERFRKYQLATADLLEEARARAEDFLREMAVLGDTTQKQAQDAFDELIQGSRKGTEQLLACISREISAQLGQFGLSSMEDFESLVGRIVRRSSPPGQAGSDEERTAGETGPADPAAAPSASPPRLVLVTEPAPDEAPGIEPETRSPAAATERAPVAGAEASATKRVGRKTAGPTAKATTKAAKKTGATTKVTRNAATAKKSATTKAAKKAGETDQPSKNATTAKKSTTTKKAGAATKASARKAGSPTGRASDEAARKH